MPQKAIAAAGQHERHADLGVALRQFQHRALQIEHGLLILTHAVKTLVRLGLESHGQLVIAAAYGLKLARGYAHVAGVVGLSHVAHEFVQQQLALFIIEGYAAAL